MSEAKLRPVCDASPLFVFGVLGPPMLVFFAFMALVGLVWLRLVSWVTSADIYHPDTPEVMQRALNILIPAVPSLALFCFGVVMACVAREVLQRQYDKRYGKLS